MFRRVLIGSVLIILLKLGFIILLRFLIEWSLIDKNLIYFKISNYFLYSIIIILMSFYYYKENFLNQLISNYLITVLVLLLPLGFFWINSIFLKKDLEIPSVLFFKFNLIFPVLCSYFVRCWIRLLHLKKGGAGSDLQLFI